MAKNLKSFRKNSNGTGGGTHESGFSQQANTADISSGDRANIESLVNEYGGKSEAELMDELMRVTALKRREGSFDPEAMRRTASSIMPMLTPEQQQKLMGIMNRLGG